MRKQESELQINCVNWFRLSFPQYRWLLFAIPNGGKRNVITATRMKREGVLSGVTDLFLSIPRNEFHGMYIELKTGNNKLTTNQETFISEVQKHGYKCEVIYSLDQFIREITYYIKSNLNETTKGI